MSYIEYEKNQKEQLLISLENAIDEANSNNEELDIFKTSTDESKYIITSSELASSDEYTFCFNLITSNNDEYFAYIN